MMYFNDITIQSSFFILVRTSPIVKIKNELNYCREKFVTLVEFDSFLHKLKSHSPAFLLCNHIFISTDIFKYLQV